jgi:TetR/AcrR family transcriptional regulator, fatty acid metabolism regulator protein
MKQKERGNKTSKREAILNAAIETFAQRGFHQARVSDVARQAGVADGTIYLYFKSKDDLLISLFEEKMEQIVQRFRLQVNRCESSRERLKCFIELHLKMVAENPSLAEVLTVELRQSAKFMREYKAPQFAEYLNLLGEIILYGQERGEISASVDPSIARRIIFGALDELSLYWVSVKKPTQTLNQAIDELWRWCSGGVFLIQQNP